MPATRTATPSLRDGFVYYRKRDGHLIYDDKWRRCRGTVKTIAVLHASPDIDVTNIVILASFPSDF